MSRLPASSVKAKGGDQVETSLHVSSTDIRFEQSWSTPLRRTVSSVPTKGGTSPACAHRRNPGSTKDEYVCQCAGLCRAGPCGAESSSARSPFGDSRGVFGPPPRHRSGTTGPGASVPEFSPTSVSVLFPANLLREPLGVRDSALYPSKRKSNRRGGRGRGHGRREGVWVSRRVRPRVRPTGAPDSVVVPETKWGHEY